MPEIELKTCKICGKEYPATNQYFNWQSKPENRLRTVCRECQNRERRIKEAETRKNNPEAYQARLDKQHDYYQRTKEERIQYTNEWRRKNPDKAQYYFNRRRKVRFAEDPVFKWTHTARCAVRRAAKCKGVGSNHSTPFLKELTGLPLLPLHNHLLKTFEEIYGYPWDRTESVEVDHIVPLCTESTIEGRQRLFHYTNLRLIKAEDNKAKGMKLDYAI